jgi:uncharacterized protein
VGGGGAVLTVPVLVYVLGLDVHEATTASLAVVSGAALVGGSRLAYERYVCWPCATVFALPAALGTYLGAELNQGTDGDLLLVLFAPVLVAAAVTIWSRAGGPGGQEPAEWRCPPLRPARTVPAGFVVGVLTGFFGVGGGFVIVPTLVVWLGLSMRRAIGTSLVIVAIVSAIGFASHVGAGSEAPWGVTAALTAATAAGALAGATFSPHVPQRQLGRGFAVLVTCLAVFLVLEVAL